MKTILLFIVGLLLLCSCNTPRIVEVERTKTVKEVVRDTAIIVQPDSSMLQALIECDSVGNAYIREIMMLKAGKNMKAPQADLSQNVLTVTAEIDSFAVYAALKDRYTETTDVKVVEKERELTRWQRIRMSLGDCVIICLAAFALYFIVEVFRKRRL